MAAYNSLDGQSMLDMYASAISDIITNYKTDLVSLLKKNNIDASDTETYDQIANKTISALQTNPKFRFDMSKMIIEISQTGGVLSADGEGWKKFKSWFSNDNLKKVNEGLDAALGITRTIGGISEELGFKRRPASGGGGSTGGGGGATGGGGGTTGGGGGATGGDSGSDNDLLLRVLEMNKKDGMSTGAIIAIVVTSLVIISGIAYFVVKSQKK